MTYEDFIQELDGLITSGREIYVSGTTHKDPRFRKWRHEAESIFSLAQSLGLTIPGPFNSKARSYLAGWSGATEADDSQSLHEHLDDSLNELEFVVSYSKRYTAPRQPNHERNTVGLQTNTFLDRGTGMDYSFKRHPITADQNLWLAQVDQAFPNFSPRAARVALEGRVAPGFTSDAIDVRLYRSRRLTMVGVWHVDSQHPRLLELDKTIRAIRQRIIAKPDLQTVTSAEIASDTGLSEKQVGEAMFAAGEVGNGFFGQADGMPGNSVAHAKLHLSDDDSANDEYLNYAGIEELLERFYLRIGNDLQASLSVSDRFGGIHMREQNAQGKRIFIVHGRNGEAKESVARFIEKLGLEAVILHERPNKGRTIITKFQEESQEVDFAIVLMTPDDEGRVRDGPSLNPRARQNVVFELGFFIGRLGADRVIAMVKGNIEKPSDFDGVVYISLDDGNWRAQLISELKSANLEGDWNKAF